MRVCTKPTSDNDLGRRHWHWYRTHEGVTAIVAAKTGQTIRPNQPALWFTHTSVVRCCANLSGADQAPWEMYGAAVWKKAGGKEVIGSFAMSQSIIKKVINIAMGTKTRDDPWIPQDKEKRLQRQKVIESMPERVM